MMKGRTNCGGAGGFRMEGPKTEFGSEVRKPAVETEVETARAGLRVSFTDNG